MSWQPLLEGALKDRASESVQAILDDLSRLGPDSVDDPSLAAGTTGLALLHGYRALTDGGPEHAALARQYLRRALAALADGPAVASLYGGLTGAGWAVTHLQSRLPGVDGANDLAEIDEVLLRHLGQSPWPENYDLIEGLVGFGVYALERLAQPAAVACLERVVDRLAETAEYRAEGITWWTNPAWLPAETREQFPRGYYNLGLAHGVPGVIALLARVCAAQIACSRAHPLLVGAVRWQLAQQGPGSFSHWVSPEGTNRPARLAWCYGDPGVAAALLFAGQCLEESTWKQAAVAIARRATQRVPEQSGVVDASLCHGAAGLGHLFNRMYQATGEPWLAEAARYWLVRTLEMRKPGRGIGGYEAWSPGEDDSLTWRAETGLLTGAAGIALALLAATTTIDPAWDRILLAAIPPRAAS
jgi:hypothetical protein